MKTLEQIADHYEYADFQALDPKAFMSALRDAERRGIERAAKVCEKDADKFHGPERKAGCLWSAAGIRALARGGEKV